MFVRATTITADPTRLDAGIAYVRDTVVPAVAAIPGNHGLSMIADRNTGTATVTTAWDTVEARADSDAALAPHRAKLVEAMGASRAVVELLELAVLDRMRPAQSGFWTRQTRVTIDPSRLEGAIDAYSSSVLHDIQLLAGYCSAVLLVDRENGHGAISVVFDSRDSLEASRGHADRVRAAGLAKAGATLVEVREAELVIAGLRVPQSG
ncbi:MAG: hypothetical protein ABR549_08885 [Mycobacteriales bacterium]